MKTEYRQISLKTPHAVTYGAGSLCRGDVLGVFFGKGKEDVRYPVFEQPGIGAMDRKPESLSGFPGFNQ